MPAPTSSSTTTPTPTSPPRTSSSEFGDDAVVVLVKGSLEQLVLTSDLATLLSLEGCLSGNAPGGAVFTDKPAPEPCAKLAETKPARVVYGPATFLNQFAIQAGKLLEAQTAATRRDARAAALAAIEQARRAGLSVADQRAAGVGRRSGGADRLPAADCSRSPPATASPGCRRSTTPPTSTRWSSTAAPTASPKPASPTSSPAPSRR